MNEKIQVNCPVFDDWKEPDCDGIYRCSQEDGFGNGECPLSNYCGVGVIQVIPVNPKMKMDEVCSLGKGSLGCENSCCPKHGKYKKFLERSKTNGKNI